MPWKVKVAQMTIRHNFGKDNSIVLLRERVAEEKNQSVTYSERTLVGLLS